MNADQRRQQEDPTQRTRRTHRTPEASCAAFACALCVLCVEILAGCGKGGPSTQPAGRGGSSQTPQGGVKAFPTFGLAIASAAGWQRGEERTASQVARWFRNGADGKTIEASISLDATPAGGRKLAEFAAAIAGPIGCSVAKDPITVDGAAALRLASALQGTEYRPRGAVVAEKAGVFYGLTLYGQGQDGGAADFETMLAGWRWIPVESPPLHLELRAEATSLPGGRFSVRLPAIARPADRIGSESVRVFFINNYVAMREDMAIEITVAPKDPGVTGGQALEATVAAAQQRLGITDPARVRPLPAKQDAWTTDQLGVTVKLPDGGLESRRVRYVLWAPLRDQTVVIEFILNAKAAESQEQYDAMAAKVVESLSHTPG